MSAFHDNALMGASGSQGYTISRSVRLRSSASAYFNRTPATAGTSNKTFTYSAWVKRGSLGSIQNLISSPSSGNSDSLRFSAADALEYNWQDTVVGQVTTTQVFRDPAAWYHIMFAMDTTQATASNRFKLYVNGVQVTAFSTASYPAQNTVVNNTAAVATKLGQYANASSQNFDGYLTEINFVDGQALTPSSFGQTNSITGVWQPIKYSGTYGTNGFYLNFSDNSAATAAAIGKDYSGNGNNWTPNNISVTSGVTYDSMIDSPTVSAASSNYAVLNPLDAQGTATLSDANLTIASATTAHKNRKATLLIPSSGKWYWELTTASTCSSSVILGWGLQTTSAATDSQAGNANTWMAQNDANQDIFNQTTSVLSTGSAVSGGSIRQVAYDADTGKLWFGINNTWYSSTDLTSGNPSAGTNQCMTLSAGDYFPTITCYNLTANANFGQRPFSYTPPTGFVALNTQNLPAPTISNGALYMAATTYTGNGATGQSVVNSGNNTAAISFKPDFVWVKVRSTAGTDHYLADSVRGATKYLQSDTTAAEGTNNGITAFNSNGFSVGAVGDTNTNGATIVGWQWQAGKGATSSNTSGSITSTVSVNATAGFSVVTYTGTGANATVGHGLGVAPSMIIIKCRDSATDPSWIVGHTGIVMGTGRLILNGTDANSNAGASSLWNSTAANSSVFSLGTYSSVNQNTLRFVAYLFAEVAGFSRFGSYTGNGSSDGPFVYLGFRPRWILLKRTDSSFGGDWEIWDTSRSTYNAVNAELYANSSSSESSATNPDILSNGFKIRSSAANYNASGGTYVYACFAENPYKLALAR
jgi:hypothetical protein